MQFEKRLNEFVRYHIHGDGACRWYESFGAKITGVKDNDYEMRIEL